MQIQYALFMARRGDCSEAINALDDLAQPVPDLAFTHDGLDSFLRSARFNYLIGNVYKSAMCQTSLIIFKQAAEQSSFEDAVWAWKASHQLPGFDHVPQNRD